RDGKAGSQLEALPPPTQPPKLLDHAPVIAIASGRRGEIPGHGERNTPCLAGKSRTLRIRRWLRKPDGFRASRKPSTIPLGHGPPLVAQWVSPPSRRIARGRPAANPIERVARLHRAQ